MASDVTRSEFDHLTTRVSVVEGEVEGEKLVTRHILEQTRRNSDDLAVIKARQDRHDDRFDALERKVDRLVGELAGLRAELPTMMGEVMREVLGERDTKR